MTHPVSQLQHQKEQLQEEIPSDRQFRFTLLQNKDCYYFSTISCNLMGVLLRNWWSFWLLLLLMSFWLWLHGNSWTKISQDMCSFLLPNHILAILWVNVHNIASIISNSIHSVSFPSACRPSIVKVVNFCTLVAVVAVVKSTDDGDNCKWTSSSFKTVKTNKLQLLQ